MSEIAWVQYAVRGRVLWHQRLILAWLQSSADEAVVLTPDGDIFVEDLDDERNSDVKSIQWEVTSGILPPSVSARNVYRFGQLPTGRVLAKLRVDGEKMADDEDVSRGWVAGGGRPAPEAARPSKPPDAVLAAPPPPLLDLGGVRPRVATPRGSPRIAEGKWVVALSENGRVVGEEVRLTGREVFAPGSQKGIFQTPDGDWIFIVRESAAVLAMAGDKTKEPMDARVLKVKYDTNGVRNRVWRDTVADMDEIEFKDWSLPGPRTVAWCARFVDRRGGGPLDHHRWWMGTLRLQVTDFGVQEHEHGMRSFQSFGEYDQVDLPSLMGLEVILRRCHMIEYHHEKRSKAVKDKGDTVGGLSRDEAAYFVGSHRTAGEVMVSPELVEWVSKEIGKDVEVVKQMRKAREESKLARKDG